MRMLLPVLLAALAALPVGNADAQERPPAPVTTALAAPAPFAHVIEALGTVQGREAVDLTARVTEKVARVHFEDGQAVEAGTLLVELDHDELDA
ncbi:MAG: biotin/lipoyl-binding protein, partial [bacterium]